ncbi:MAG TPA: hypothetical protein VIL74_20840 [Pyrinomonadaceae bacterium]
MIFRKITGITLALKYVLRVLAAIVASGGTVAVLINLLPYELATAIGLAAGAVFGSVAVLGMKGIKNY